MLYGDDFLRCELMLESRTDSILVALSFQNMNDWFPSSAYPDIRRLPRHFNCLHELFVLIFLRLYLCFFYKNNSDKKFVPEEIDTLNFALQDIAAKIGAFRISWLFSSSFLNNSTNFSKETEAPARGDVE